MIKKILLSSVLAQSFLLADTTLAPSRLEVKDGYNMYLQGEFLWWLSQNDNLFFCQEGPIASPQNSFNGTLKRIPTGFVPGGRLTFGGLMAYDHWDIHFTWTYFTQYNSAESNNPAYYIGNTFGNSSLSNWINANYNINLNMLDAIMTRPSWVGERFSISPYIGARGTWLAQVYKTTAQLATSAPNYVYNRSRSDFQGAGLLAGFGLRYELRSGWCIEGNFLSSGIYGKFVNYFSGYLNDSDNFPDNTRLAFSQDHNQSMLFDIEYKLGIGYNHFLNNGRYHLGGGIAWEEVIFLNGNRLPMWNTALNNDISSPGLSFANPSPLLTLQGITLRFIFGF